MSKYIIEIAEEYEEYFKGVLICGIADGKFAVDVIAREDLEELNSDYINEHYGELQDEAYQRGHDDGYEAGCATAFKPVSDEEYQRGLEDAWEAARALVWDTSISEYETAGVKVDDWDGETCEVLRRYPAHEAVELLRTIRERKDSRIEVGDEVRNKVNGLTYIVTLASECGYVLLGSDGNCATSCVTNSFEKTGKHYDIASILEAMRTHD